MSSHSLVRVMVALLVLSAAGVLGLAGCASTAAPGPALRVIAASDRRPAPQLRGELLDGGAEFDLTEHAGQLVVVNFWASWCSPCVAEADDLETTYQSAREHGVAFVGVNVRDERDKARAFVLGRVSYPSVFDPTSRVALAFAVPPTSIPATIIIDRQGRVAATAFGAVLASQLEPVVAQLAMETSRSPAPSRSP